nr:MAG TPA: hypothetical protein [Caudoviricetes sp.]
MQFTELGYVVCRCRSEQLDDNTKKQGPQPLLLEKP